MAGRRATRAVTDLDTARWLASGDAASALDLARSAAAGRDPLAAAAWLRARLPDLDPARIAAALAQADLEALARHRHGVEVPLLLTRDGLEQATRPQVAARRAAALAAAGARRVVDLTAGLGLDTRAFLAAGLDVVAVERDPATAVLLAANAPGATVVEGDAWEILPTLLPTLAPTDVVFADPARRDPAGPRDNATGRARPERDPARWSPPWPKIASIAHPRVVAKVAPAFEPPAGWQGQWTSWDRVVVEGQVASWALAAADRRAVVWSRVGDATAVDATPADPLRYLASDDALPPALYEPDPAVIRAGAVGALAVQHGLLGLDPASSWLVGRDTAPSPAMRRYVLMAELTGPTRDRRRQLTALGIDRLVVKSRDVRTDPVRVRRELAVAEGGDHVLVLTHRAGRTIHLLAAPLPRRC